MQCKHCKSNIPDNMHPVFCCYCGARLIKDPNKKNEIKVPAAVKHGHKWRIDLRKEGVIVSEDTEAEATAKAKAIRAGFIASGGALPKLTLRQVVDKYISERDSILSPSTIRGYRNIQKNAFPNIMDLPIASIKNWQAEVNKETKRVKAQTLHNEWKLIQAALAENGVDVTAALPQIVAAETPWLDFEQIKVFLEVIRGRPCEMGALFALHGLRRSELLAVTPNKIKGQVILVEGSAVIDANNTFVFREENKNKSSRREVPIMIPRLTELINAYDGDPDKPFLQYSSQNVLYGQINAACRAAGLPEVGVHGLRRSFASLAYHLGWSEHQTMAVGGWSNPRVMHKVYTKLAKSDTQKDIQKMRKFYDFTP